MSPTSAMNVAAVMTSTPGTVISRSISGQLSACSGTAAVPVGVRLATRSVRRGAGLVEPDEDPKAAAARQAADAAAYVTTVYEAIITSGQPSADGEETIDVRWVATTDPPTLDLDGFARATLARIKLLVP